MAQSDGRLVVWDSLGKPYVGADPCVDWNSYSTPEGVLSLLRHVEENAEALRDRYLAWIDECGLVEVGGRRVIDHLAVPSTDFSLWWMTSLFEKSVWQSPSLSIVVRLMAIEDLVEASGPAVVIVESDQQEVRSAVRILCEERGIEYRTERRCWWRPSDLNKRWLRRLVPRFALATHALGSFLLQHWADRRSRPRRWASSEDSVFFFSYFGRLDPSSAGRGVFDWGYWDGLDEVVDDLSISTNWFHHAVPTAEIPDRGTVRTWLGRINLNPEDQGNHALVTAYIAPSTMIRAIRRWWHQWFRSMITPSLSRFPLRSERHGYLWPVVRREWIDDLRGRRSMENQIIFAVMEEACRSLPPQRRGFLLCEGIAWERAFVHAWRQTGHGELTGVPHATVPIWDLRFFVHPETRARSGPYALPEPDRMVVNNRALETLLASTGYPPGRIVKAESLRFGKLAEPLSADRFGHPCGGESFSPLRILVLGELRPQPTARILAALQAALPTIGTSVEVHLRAHPNSGLDRNSFPKMDLREADGPMENLVGYFTLAVSANATSAALHARLLGLPVVVWLNDGDLNLSDLRGMESALFASSSEELVVAIEELRRFPAAEVAPESFFNLTKDLPLWRRLLAGAPD